jgi:hypothetical protein
LYTCAFILLAITTSSNNKFIFFIFIYFIGKCNLFLFDIKV